MLAADVIVVFLSVVYRYFLHDPVDWAEEVARAALFLASPDAAYLTGVVLPVDGGWRVSEGRIETRDHA